MLDGGMTYGFGSATITAIVRVVSNIFRNRNEIIETVF